MTIPDESTQQEISRLTREGNRHLEAGRFDEAKSHLYAALKLVPEPHSRFEAATWLYVSLGDIQFHLHDFELAFHSFASAVECPAGLGNPFIHLRLGQASFELGDLARAAEELTRAYQGGGLEILEEDDPKYLAFLGTRIEIADRD
jgi:tetratricopeptide (TPR) repeat protein